MQTQLQNMLQTKFKNQQIDTFQNFQFLFYYRVISKNVLITIQKPQLCYCPDGLMVKLSCTKLHARVRIPFGPIFFFFPNFFLLQVHTG